jgi:methionyl-tRNA formyltransferase
VVWRAAVCPSELGDEPERLVTHGNGLALAAAGGRLRLDEVQLAGRGRVTGAELRRGYPGLLGKLPG